MKRLFTLVSLLVPLAASSAQSPVAPSISYAPGHATVNSTAPSNVVTPSATTTCNDCGHGSKLAIGSRIKGLFSRKTSGECASCGKDGLFGKDGIHGGAHGPLLGKLHYVPPPPANGGTLAFPHHTYIRSPRDWFMED